MTTNKDISKDFDTEKTNSIKIIYSSIKNNNLDLFKSNIFSVKDEFFSFNENKNFILYAIENNSDTIIEYLFNNDEFKDLTNNYVQKTVFSKRGSNQLNLLGYIINKNNFNLLSNFFSLLPKHVTDCLLKNDTEQGLYLSLTKLDKNNFNLFYEHYNNLLDDDILSRKIGQYTPLFLVSNFNNSGHIPLIDLFSEEQFNETNLDGYTPFLLACKYSNKEIVQKFLEKSDFYAKTKMDNDCLLISCFNKDPEVLKYLLSVNKKQSNPISHDSYSPIHIAIIEQLKEHLPLLLPIKEDISHSIVELSSHFKSDSSKKFFFDLLPNLNSNNLDKLLNEKNSAEFWGNIFSNFTLTEIKNLLNSNVFNESFNLTAKSNLSHYLYHNTVVGRKDINDKINFLLERAKIINPENSETVFSPLIINNELYYKNNTINVKPTKSFCFTSSLMSLPINQIKSILDNTNVVKQMSNFDFLLLYSIGLQKKSLSFLKSLKDKFKYKLPEIDNLVNVENFVENNLISSSNKNELGLYDIKFKSKYQFLISKFSKVPNNLLAKMAFDVLDDISSKDKVKDINKTIEFFNNNAKFKHAFSNSLISLLLQKDNVSPELKEYYKKLSNDVSKVCFSKLVNLEKVSTLKDKKTIDFLKIPFANLNDNNVLSSIVLEGDEDNELYQNMNIYQNVKDNFLFEIFADHQKRNINSKHYTKDVIKSYNLRLWCILLSIVDSENPFADSIINKMLNITDFNTPNYKSEDQNISIENFQKLYKHFILKNNFWDDLTTYYSKHHNLTEKLTISKLFIEYLSSTDNNVLNIDESLLDKHLALLEINNEINDEFVLKVMNSILEGQHNNVNLLLKMDNYVSGLSDNAKEQLIKECLVNEQFSYLNYLIDGEPNLIKLIKFDTLFSSYSFNEKIISINLVNITEENTNDFSSFVDFLEKHSKFFSSEQISVLLRSIIKLNEDLKDRQVTNFISHLFLSAIGHNISRCDDEELLKLCELNFEALLIKPNNRLSFDNSFFFEEKNEYLNKFLNVVFNNKNKSFIKHFNDMIEDTLKEHLNFDNLAILREQRLAEKLEVTQQKSSIKRQKI